MLQACRSHRKVECDSWIAKNYLFAKAFGVPETSIILDYFQIDDVPVLLLQPSSFANAVIFL